MTNLHISFPSCPSFSKTSAEVEYRPDLPFFPPFKPSLIYRISPNCLGEAILNSSSAKRNIFS